MTTKRCQKWSKVNQKNWLRTDGQSRRADRKVPTNVLVCVIVLFSTIFSDVSSFCRDNISGKLINRRMKSCGGKTAQPNANIIQYTTHPQKRAWSYWVLHLVRGFLQNLVSQSLIRRIQTEVIRYVECDYPLKVSWESRFRLFLRWKHCK